MRFVPAAAAVAMILAIPLGAGAAENAALARKFDLLDRRAASFQSEAQERLPASVQKVTGFPAVRYGGVYRGPYLDLARAAAARHGVPADLFARLVDTESGWNPRAVSPKGAVGLAQLMPATARHLGVNPRDPRQNLDGAARYLKRQFDDFRDWRLALAAYNAGPDAVRKYGGVPPFAETRAYVVAILGN